MLQYDLLKSYVRLPDFAQRRIVEFGHSIGIPISTHEVYPAAFVGMDGSEHTSGTSRRGYSPKLATLQRSYEDVARIFGSGCAPYSCRCWPGRALRPFTRRIRRCVRIHASSCIPQWMQAQVAAGGAGLARGRAGRAR